MYSRRTGVLQTSSEGLKKIESFNKNLREQYNSRGKSPTVASNTDNQLPKKQSNDITSKIGSLIENEEVILIALILFLLFDINRDYLIIGILAMLLLLN